MLKSEIELPKPPVVPQGILISECNDGDIVEIVHVDKTYLPWNSHQWIGTVALVTTHNWNNKAGTGTEPRVKALLNLNNQSGTIGRLWHKDYVPHVRVKVLPKGTKVTLEQA